MRVPVNAGECIAELVGRPMRKTFLLSKIKLHMAALCHLIPRRSVLQYTLYLA